MRIISPLGNHENVVCDVRNPDLLPCRFSGEIVGFFQDAPRRCVTDVFAEAEQALTASRVMILYLDGLGWRLYKRAALPFIQNTFSCEVARTVYPPVTQPCMASMLTGCLPDEHGVLSRRHHRLSAPSLMRHEGAVLIEADEELLVLEKSPVLTLPRRGENVDSAVLRAALPYASGNTPLLIVHFHGLDDLEHRFGDDEPALREKLTELDNAVLTLCEAFTGRVILCADHGVHLSGDAGSHGEFDYRDMFVPYGVTTV